MRKQRFFGLVGGIVLWTVASLLLGCKSAADQSFRVGCMAGPESELVQVAAGVAKAKYDLNVQVLPFEDYHLPNLALQEGSLAANVFQHAPYLRHFNRQQGTKLVAVAKTFIFPMGIYSKRFAKLSDLPKTAVIAIPNDPSNETRALRLLAKQGLIALKDAKRGDLTPKDVRAQRYVFKALDAAMLPRALADVDAAVINTNYALLADLRPSKDALAVEAKTSEYANVIATRPTLQGRVKLQQWIKAMHSQAVIDAAKRLFSGEAVAAW